MKKIIGTLLLVSLSGCASAYLSYSVGQTGCDQDEIEISHLKQNMLNETWVASCQGKRFVCSRTGNVGSWERQVSCKEAVKQVSHR